MEQVETALYSRLPHETARAFRAFSIYRDAGPTRSLSAVSEVLRAQKVVGKCKKSGRVSSVIGRWSSKYFWVERARMYDQHLDQERRREREHFIREREDKQLKLAEKVIDKALACLDVWQPATVTIQNEPDENGQALPVRVVKSKVTPQGIAALVKAGVETERLALGLATGRERDKDEQLTIDELFGEIKRLSGTYETPTPRAREGGTDASAQDGTNADGVDAPAPTD